jgi:peptide/nickel transport system substrate-binding protein
MKKLVMLAALPAAALLMAQAAQPAPVRGGNLVVAMNVEPAFLDPSQGAGAEIVRMMHQNVLEGLVGIAENGRITPQLAAAMPSVTPDRLTYTFKLKRNVKFHDGTDFTSADVKVKFDVARDEKSGHSKPDYYKDIASVTTPDPLTVVFKMTRANNEFLYNLARADSIIEPSELFATVAGRAKLKSDPIGTGPFKLGAWNRGVNVRLDRNNSYYVANLPYLDNVTFRFLGEDQNARVAGLRSGDIDVIGYNVPVEQIDALKKDFNVVVGPSSAEATVSLNNGRKPFNDIRVRRAFNAAMDKKAIVQGGFFGYGTIIGSFNSPGQQYYIDLTNRNPYNPEQAKKWLAQAGQSNMKVKFTVANEFPTERRTAEIYAQQLAAIGVTVEIELVPFNTWIQKVFLSKDYDMTIIGHAEAFDLNAYAIDGYYFNWNNAPYKALYEKALVANTDAERYRLYAAMQIMLADQVPGVWAFSIPYVAATRKNIYGWWASQPTPNANAVRVFKTK